jgi:periplasmic protein TonB
MFEDSTFESMGRIGTRSGRWMMATLAGNAVLVSALALIPLFHPEALPHRLVATPMDPAPKPDPVKPVRVPIETALSQPHSALAPIPAPTVIPKTPLSPEEPQMSQSIDMSDWPGLNNASSGVVGLSSGGNKVVLGSAEPGRPVRIPSSLVVGLLLDKVTPTYPAIAKAAGVEGTVVLEATISKSGTIENLRAIAGPALLIEAAINAVSRWRYRPYRLNGQSVEVQTTIQVVFRLH